MELALRAQNEIDPDETLAIKVVLDGGIAVHSRERPEALESHDVENRRSQRSVPDRRRDHRREIAHETFTERRFRDPTILALVDGIEAMPSFPAGRVCPVDDMPARSYSQIRRGVAQAADVSGEVEKSSRGLDARAGCGIGRSARSRLGHLLTGYRLGDRGSELWQYARK